MTRIEQTNEWLTEWNAKFNSWLARLTGRAWKYKPGNEMRLALRKNALSRVLCRTHAKEHGARIAARREANSAW